MTREEILREAKPILFNTEMVKAILDDRKTVTRRVVKPHGKQKDFWKPMHDRFIIQRCGSYGWQIWLDKIGNSYTSAIPPCDSDDYLYVRETWCERLGDQSKRGKYIYKAHTEPQDELHQRALDLNRWRPSIHMPKEAARLFLRVKDVRVERLWEITEEQAYAEGTILPSPRANYVNSFIPLWDSTIKPADLPLYGWEANPFVWVIEFERVVPE